MISRSNVQRLSVNLYSVVSTRYVSSHIAKLSSVRKNHDLLPIADCEGTVHRTVCNMILSVFIFSMYCPNSANGRLPPGPD